MIYHIYANRSNIGDWLSAKGIQKLLAPHEITECLCDEPFIEETIKTLSAAGPDDLIVIGGGGLLMDYFTPFWKAIQPIAGKVPFCIWGIGCCDLKYEACLPPVSLIEEIVSKSSLCIVRDDITRSFLSNCNLPEPVACPSINVIEPVAKKGDDILHVANYTTAGADAYELMRATGMKYAEERQLIFRETNNRIEKNTESEMDQVLLRYRKSGIVLSSALHGCIISIAMGLKVVAVSGDRKIDAFMETIGLGDWVLDTMELERVTELLQAISLQTHPVARLDQIRKQNLNVAQNIQQIYRPALAGKNSVF